MQSDELNTLLHKLKDVQSLPDVEQAVENALLSYVTQNNRVCPIPASWDGVYQLLPDKNRSVPPLILAAWDASDEDKANRLKQQIIFAKEHHVLLHVAKYLLALPDDQWTYNQR